MATEAGIKHLRKKYHGAPLPERPFPVDEKSWVIFTAYVYEEHSLRELHDREGISIKRLRQMLCNVDAELEDPSAVEGAMERNALQLPLDELALSNRAMNTLHRLGCRTVHDILQLDMSGPLPRVGVKTRMEVLDALQHAGLRHPAAGRRPMAGVTSLARSLERMQERINAALRSVSKEVSVVQRHLQDWLKE